MPRGLWNYCGPHAKIACVLEEPNDFCRLWLLRHPELETGASDIAVGAGPADLSRRGRTQILRWMELLKDVEVERVTSGPQPQCNDAARGLAESKKLEVVVDSRLRDQEMGQWQGRSWQEIMRDQDGPVRTFFSEFGDSAAPGGERLGEAVERMLQWWAETMPKVAGKTIVVVGAGTILTGFAAAMLGMRLSRCLSLNLPYGGIGILDAFENGVRVSSWNADVWH
ncbi:MAG: broad specificity phosphatase PhoE [Neolewinella sp.]